MSSKKPSNRESRLVEESEIFDYLNHRAEIEEDKIRNRVQKNFALGAAKDKLFLTQFQEIAEKVFRNKIVVPKSSLKSMKGPVERMENILLSDLHFQSLVDPRECPVGYGPVEEARSLAAVVLQAAEFKPQYRENSILNVHLCGDIIQGQLHDQRDGAPLAEQVAAAMYLLIQAIAYWSGCYSEVIVRCTPGNHGRNKDRHPERAIHQKWDSIETMVYYGIKMGVKDLPNVRVEIPYTPYITYDSFGQKAFGTHGDTVINPGNPGKAINIESIRKQTNEWNSQFVKSERYQLFFVGHVHFASNVILPNGIRFISNGCLVPPDSFAISGGYFTTCGQWLWESVPGHIVGDSRFIVVDENIHKDKDLDKIIKPFSSL